MQPDTVKAKILAAVATGSTVSDAVRVHGLTPGQGRDAISRLCRDFKLPPDISKIQASPKKYLDVTSEIAMSPRYALRKDLRNNLQRCLKIKSSTQLTPEYVSNITASMLLGAGITEVGVSEIQEWLVENGTTLKQRAPSDEYTTSAKRAIFFLDSFGFDVTKARSQLGELDG